MADSNSDETRRRAKGASNRRHYARSKAERDHVLLRLERGGAAELDAFAGSAGMSRSACARLFLPAVLGALAPRLARIERARAANGLSLEQFVGRAIDEALSSGGDAQRPAAPPAADEFDRLFG